ncbi:MAG: translesion DNA synthesis-associated protein ImuA [Nevskia sp.]|nr:translesion DNA synthesis-associated protein ImuA [Nevskia sp.]
MSAAAMGAVPSRAAAALDALAAMPGIWRGFGRLRPDAEPTGNAQLDAALAGGWPAGALSQVVGSETGLGFSLLLPLLARMTQAGRPAALVAPPYIPYAPALRDAGVALEHLLWITPKDRLDALWATEQMLRSGLFGTVALWSPPLDASVERRLQLAAETGRSVGIVSHAHAGPANSVAAVRLQVSAAPDGLQVEVLRCRGARPGAQLRYPLPRAA